MNAKKEKMGATKQQLPAQTTQVVLGATVNMDTGRKTDFHVNVSGKKYS